MTIGNTNKKRMATKPKTRTVIALNCEPRLHLDWSILLDDVTCVWLEFWFHHRVVFCSPSSMVSDGKEISQIFEHSCGFLVTLYCPFDQHEMCICKVKWIIMNIFGIQLSVWWKFSRICQADRGDWQIIWFLVLNIWHTDKLWNGILN